MYTAGVRAARASASVRAAGAAAHAPGAGLGRPLGALACPWPSGRAEGSAKRPPVTVASGAEVRPVAGICDIPGLGPGLGVAVASLRAPRVAHPDDRGAAGGQEPGG